LVVVVVVVVCLVLAGSSGVNGEAVLEAKRVPIVGTGLDGEELFSINYVPGDLNVTAEEWGSGAEARVVGGTSIKKNEFPYATIVYFGNTMCGGALISPTHVLTAGHCCYRKSASSVTVQYNVHNRCQGSSQQVGAKKVDLHGQYNDRTLENDICLVHLKREAVVSRTAVLPETPVKPVSMSDGSTERLTVVGWGTTSYMGSAACVGQKVTIPTINCLDPDMLYKGSSSQSILAGPSNFCAYTPNKDACQGDSGGPFLLGDELKGLVSWGIECAKARYPGVYTDVFYFRDWILQRL